MNYLDSYEYKEWKEKLSGEYLEKFDAIEQYYVRSDTRESYEVQLTLSQILGDFLLAQEEGKPLERIIGKDIRKYAVQMLQAEYDTHKKGSFYWINLSVIMMGLILFLIFVKTFLFHGYDELSFMEKSEHIYLGLFEIFIIVISFLVEFIRMKMAAFLFFRPRLISLFRIITTLPCSLIIILYNDKYIDADRIFAVRIPALLFAVLAIPATIYLITASFISIKKTKAKKSELVTSQNEIIPEQVSCPSCGKNHDYDYPKCPFCGHKALEDCNK